MAEINLPDMSLLWASAGDVLKPSDSKIQQGWAPEVPPRQWFNWLDNRQDEAIAHIAQHGIAVWSDTIEYQAGKSYVQGSDGIVYKAITTNTNVNPVGNVGDWEKPFLTATDVYTKAQVDAKTTIASTAQAQAQTNNTTLISPLRLAEAFSGTKHSLSQSGHQIFPGGLILQWGIAVTDATGKAVGSWPTSFANFPLVAVANVYGATNTGEARPVASGALTNTTYTFWTNSPLAGVLVNFLVVGY